MGILSANEVESNALITGYDIKTITKQDLIQVMKYLKSSFDESEFQKTLLKRIIDFLIVKFNDVKKGEEVNYDNYLEVIGLNQENLTHQKLVGVNESTLFYILQIENSEDMKGFYDFCKGVLNNILNDINTEILKLSSWEYKSLSKESLIERAPNDNAEPQDAGRFNFALQNI